MTDLERSVSGFEVDGDWSEVVEHGERITAAIQAAGRAGEAFEEWNDWRPRADERLETDVREKTAEHAHLEAGPGEEANQSVGDDLRNAGNELANGEDTSDNEDEHDATEYVGRALDSVGRKTMRPIEDAVYKRMVTTASGQYFDNDLISAEINGTDSGYRFEVEIINDELKDTVEEAIAQQPDHWHVENNVETDTIEASEDIDLPDASKSPDSEMSDTTQSEDDESEDSNGS